jgi:hypothetical protein
MLMTGFVLDRLMLWSRRRLLPWQDEMQDI